MDNVWLNGVHKVENGFLCICIFSLILIGVSELSLVQRILGHYRVPDAEMLIRHLTLVLGMMGGLMAAREGKLLCISSIRDLLPEKFRSSIIFFTGLVGVSVSLWLGLAALQFVLIEREFGDTLSMGVPFWWFQAFLPIGFFGITIRLFIQNASSLKMGGLSAILLVLLLATVLPHESESTKLVWPYLTILGVATLLGTPIFVAIGGAAVLLFWGQGDPVASVALDHYDQVTNPLLATLPLFTIAGFFLILSLLVFANGLDFLDWFRNL